MIQFDLKFFADKTLQFNVFVNLINERRLDEALRIYDSLEISDKKFNFSRITKALLLIVNFFFIIILKQNRNVIKRLYFLKIKEYKGNF